MASVKREGSILSARSSHRRRQRLIQNREPGFVAAIVGMKPIVCEERAIPAKERAGHDGDRCEREVLAGRNCTHYTIDLLCAARGHTPQEPRYARRRAHV